MTTIVTILAVVLTVAVITKLALALARLITL